MVKTSKFITVALLAMMLGFGIFGQTASAEIDTYTTVSFNTNTWVSKDSFVVAYATASGAPRTITAYSDSTSTPTTIIALDGTDGGTLSSNGGLSVSFPVKANMYFRVNTTGTGQSIKVYPIPDNMGDPLIVSCTPQTVSLGQYLSLNIECKQPNGLPYSGRASYINITIYSSNGTAMVYNAHPVETSSTGCYPYTYVLTNPRNGVWRVIISHWVSGYGTYYASCSFIDPVYSVEELFVEYLKVFSTSINNSANATIKAGQLQADALNNISIAINNIEIPDYSEEINNISLISIPDYSLFYSDFLTLFGNKIFAYDYHLDNKNMSDAISNISISINKSISQENVSINLNTTGIEKEMNIQNESTKEMVYNIFLILLVGIFILIGIKYNNIIILVSGFFILMGIVVIKISSNFFDINIDLINNSITIILLCFAIAIMSGMIKNKGGKK